MRLRELLIKRLAEAWGFDLAAALLCFVAMFVLLLAGRSYWPMLSFGLFFIGYFSARQTYTPEDKRPRIGLEPMSREEFDELFRKKGTR